MEADVLTLVVGTVGLFVFFFTAIAAVATGVEL